MHTNFIWPVSVLLFKNSLSSTRELREDPVKQLSPTQAAMVTIAPFHRAFLMVCKALGPLSAQSSVPEGMY